MNPGDQLVLFVAHAWLFVLASFALPSLIAFRRGDPNRWLILVINASVVGWAVALIMAVCPLFRQGGPTVSDDGDTGRQANHAPLLLLASQVHAGAMPPAERLSAATAVAEIERLGRLRSAGTLAK